MIILQQHSPLSRRFDHTRNWLSSRCITSSSKSGQVFFQYEVKCVIISSWSSFSFIFLPVFHQLHLFRIMSFFIITFHTIVLPCFISSPCTQLPTLLVWRDYGVSLWGRITDLPEQQCWLYSLIALQQLSPLPRKFNPSETGWAQDALLKWLQENWYFYLDMSRSPTSHPLYSLNWN